MGFIYQRFLFGQTKSSIRGFDWCSLLSNVIILLMDDSRYVVRNFNIQYCSSKFVAFFVGICGGIVGVLVDFDHPIAFFLGIKDGRFFHYSLFFIVFLVFCGLCTYMGRLLFKLVLRKN